jgi:hypothetical protein
MSKNSNEINSKYYNHLWYGPSSYAGTNQQESAFEIVPREKKLSTISSRGSSEKISKDSSSLTVLTGWSSNKEKDSSNLTINTSLFSNGSSLKSNQTPSFQSPSKSSSTNTTQMSNSSLKLKSSSSTNSSNNKKVVLKEPTKHVTNTRHIKPKFSEPKSEPNKIITKEKRKDSLETQLPPLIIRVAKKRKANETIKNSKPIEKKVITVPSKSSSPMKRKLIIEYITEIPVKTEHILPKKQATREAINSKPRNLIIQCEQPNYIYAKKYYNLGIIRADPADYIKRYGSEVVDVSKIPSFIRNIVPKNIKLASDNEPSMEIPKLVGDVEILKFIDLEKEGLVEYRSQIFKTKSK